MHRGENKQDKTNIQITKYFYFLYLEFFQA